MTACIVGWNHMPFGKHEGADVEDLILKVAGAALDDAGVGPSDIDESLKEGARPAPTPAARPSARRRPDPSQRYSVKVDGSPAKEAGSFAQIRGGGRDRTRTLAQCSISSCS